MQSLIEAAFPTAGEPTFPGAQGAIEHSAQSLLAADRSAELTSCLGKTIERVVWCGRDLTFYLAGGKAIRLGCTHESMDWSVQTQAPPASCECDAESDQDIQMLTLNGTQIAWQRAKLARERVGHELRRLQPGHVTAYIYAAGCKTLMVAVLINSKSGQPFLYWEETP